MSLPEDIFALWAPDSSPWSVWTKPVLFAQMPPSLLHRAPGSPPLELTIPPLPAWFPTSSAGAAIVIDCPGPLSVALGMGAAQAGYRPVPLFNSLPGPSGQVIAPVVLLSDPPTGWPVEVVEVRPTQEALMAASGVLLHLRLPEKAPPAFLLDSKRRRGSGPLFPKRFDNRSVSFPTDFPSANFLLSQGIKRALLIQEKEVAPDSDLAHTLLRWQQGGIYIQSVALEGGEPMERFIEKPSLFGWLWYRLGLMVGMRPALGGFGGLIPEPSSSG